MLKVHLPTAQSPRSPQKNEKGDSWYSSFGDNFWFIRNTMNSANKALNNESYTPSLMFEKKEKQLL